MNKLTGAIATFYALEYQARNPYFVQKLHPLSKLVCTICYISFVVSFSPYAFVHLLAMGGYLLITFTLAHLSIRRCIMQIKVLLLLICLIGIFNPFFDRMPIIVIGPIIITSGLLSMLTLILKGCLAIMASYLLIATTSMEAICYALKCLHIPNILTASLLLNYHYLLLLLHELQQMTEAYHLRAVHQKGLHIKTWGTFIGYFLLRCIDRADAIANSMLLRGYKGVLTVKPHSSPLCINLLYCCFWLLFFILLRLC